MKPSLLFIPHAALPLRAPRAPLSAVSRRSLRVGRRPPRASQEREVADDDAALQRELRAKVKELFGGHENVSIMVQGDSAEFTVRRRPDGSTPSEYQQAVTTVVSITVISVVAGLLFAYLYYSGAVHGSPRPERGYDTTRYSTRTYTDPYERLSAEDAL